MILILLILGGWLVAGALFLTLGIWRVRAGRTPDWYR